jgi:phosphoserine phosphatase RsbU/P
MNSVSPQGKVLIVDDTAENIHLLMNLLKDEYAIVAAKDGEKALKLIQGQNPPDIVLLDIVMPGMDGYAVCRRLKEDERTREIPVIFITALSEAEDEARGLNLGAVDYITKPFNPAIVKARVRNHLALREAYQALEKSQRALAAELALASDYVMSLLPEPLVEGPIMTQWRFIPTSRLGGDIFGYHFLDEDHFAFYLLDVCDHGVGPALLSVQALNALRSETLPGVDFRDPGQVLSKLNETFQMERHNDLYFSMIYAVYNLPQRRLRFATAGHPPALLRTPGGTLVEIVKNNAMIGVMPESSYAFDELEVAPDSQLFVYSDGVFEVRKPTGEYWSFSEFKEFMSGLQASGRSEIDILLEYIRTLGGSDILEDDFSMLKVVLT